MPEAALVLPAGCGTEGVDIVAVVAVFVAAMVVVVAVVAGVVALTPPSNKTHWVALLQATVS